MNDAYTGGYWNPYAHAYDEGADYVIGQNLRRAVAGRLFRERRLGSVLECGCGTGFYTKEIAPHADVVTAADISPEMLAVAGQRLEKFANIVFAEADAEALPFRTGMFDTVLLANILNTVEAPLPVLRESFRMLRYDGRLIVIVYTDFDMDGMERANLALRYFQKFGLPPPWGLHNFSPETLQDIVREAGFTMGTLTVFGDNPKAVYLKASKKIRRRRSSRRQISP